MLGAGQLRVQRAVGVGERRVVVLAVAARGVQRRGAHALLGLQRLEDLLVVELQRLAELAHRRRAAEAGGQLGAVLVDLQRALLQLARRADRPAAVAEVAAQLADDRGDGEARERDPARGVKAIDGLEQAEARDLQQVVEGLLGLAVALGDRPRQRQEALHERLTQPRVTAFGVGGEQLGVGLGRARRLDSSGAKRGQDRHEIQVPVRTIQ